MARLTPCPCGSGRRAKHWRGSGRFAAIVCDECAALGIVPGEEALADRIAHLLGAGHSYREAARQLGLLGWRLLTVAERAGLRFAHSERPGLRRLSAVARLFGRDQTIIAEWIACGWLRAIRRGRAVWIQHEDLLAFLEDQECWMLWEPENMTDPALARWAKELRGPAGWRWIGTREAAERLGYSHVNITLLIRTDCLPALKRRGAYWLRSDIVERAAANLDLLPGVGGGTDRGAARRRAFRAAIGAPIQEVAA